MRKKKPRTCVPIGTTNEKQFLSKDATGNRRYLPVETGDCIDIDGLIRDRDQLFAEALALAGQGVKHYPSREFERQFLAPQQDARTEPDILAEPVAEYLDRLPQPKQTTLAEVAANALGYEDPREPKNDGRNRRQLNQIGPKDRRLTDIMTALGWEPTKMTYRNVWRPKKVTAGERIEAALKHGATLTLLSDGTEDAGPRADGVLTLWLDGGDAGFRLDLRPVTDRKLRYRLRELLTDPSCRAEIIEELPKALRKWMPGKAWTMD